MAQMMKASGLNEATSQTPDIHLDQHMVVSQIGGPQYAPKYYSPSYWDPKIGTPNIGKPPITRERIRTIKTACSFCKCPYDTILDILGA